MRVLCRFFTNVVGFHDSEKLWKQNYKAVEYQEVYFFESKILKTL